jgi:hypothetical protein
MVALPFCYAEFYYSPGGRSAFSREARMPTSQRPSIQVTWIRDDRAHDEARYRVQVFGKDARVFDIRISLTAKAQAKPSPEEKIKEWFKHNPLANSGALEKIPDFHFSAH